MLFRPQNLSGPSLVLAEAVSWRTPDNQPILDRATLSLGREKTGLVGANGTGKTTLARLLAGNLTPSGGRVWRTGAVAFLPQNGPRAPDQSVAGALGIEAKLAALSRLTAGEGTDEDLAVLDDDWALEARVAGELQRLGLAHLGLDRPLASLSGGEVTRVLLAGLFLQNPDLLILDEPTNHLDGTSREALYGAVRTWEGGLLAVSHDRDLLGLMDRIAELSPHGLRVYGGNFDLYREQRDAEDAAARRQLGEAVKQCRQTRREVQAMRERQDRRNGRGRKGRATAGLPTILLNARQERSERTTSRLAGTGDEKTAAAAAALAAARERVAERAELDIVLSPVEVPAGKVVLDLRDVSFRHAGTSPAVLTGFHLRVTGPERVAVVGPNGSGKTTLLRLIAGQLEPLTGSVSRGVERVSYLDQQASLLRSGQSVLDNFRAHNPGLSETACRLTLARFLFRADAVHRPAGTLSGGERLRAALACVLSALTPPQLLILDEPSNHLDLDSLANLEQALRQYRGALVVASHDRAFLHHLGVTRRLELAPGQTGDRP